MLALQKVQETNVILSTCRFVHFRIFDIVLIFFSFFREQSPLS